MIWTVARSPNGSWTTGGLPNSPEYEHREVFEVEARDRKTATRKAQALRRAQLRGTVKRPVMNNG